MRPISSYSTPPNCAFIPGLIGVVFPESAIPLELFGECEVERHRFAAGVTGDVLSAVYEADGGAAPGAFENTGSQGLFPSTVISARLMGSPTVYSISSFPYSMAATLPPRLPSTNCTGWPGDAMKSCLRSCDSGAASLCDEERLAVDIDAGADSGFLERWDLRGERLLAREVYSPSSSPRYLAIVEFQVPLVPVALVVLKSYPAQDPVGFAVERAGGADAESRWIIRQLCGFAGGV